MARLGRARVKRITEQPFLVQTAGASLAADSSLTPSGVRVAPGALALVSDSSLTPNGTLIQPANPVLNASASLLISGTGGAIALPAHSTLTITGVGETAVDPFLLTSDSTLLTTTVETGNLLLASDTSLMVSGIQVAQGFVLLSSDTRLTAPGKSGFTSLVAASYLIATGVAPSRAPLVFLDMSASVTPPDGYLEPLPLLMGPNQQPNDVRILFVSASESASGGVAEEIQMNPDPPSGFTKGYALAPGFETRGVYYRRLVGGDVDTSVSWIKPVGWLDFIFGLVTARGVDPNMTPVAGDLTSLMSHKTGNSTMSIGPVAIPSPGLMLFCVWVVPDPENIWPAWAGAVGGPTGWTNLIATDKSGNTYYQTDSNPSLMMAGKSFSTSGTTGTVIVPINPGSHAFAGMYIFLKPAPDVSIAVTPA